MRYPKLVKKLYCKTPITVTVYKDEIGEDGEPIKIGTLKTTCNYQANSTKKYGMFNAETVTKSTVLFSDDIFPELDNITSGIVIVNGETREIALGEKARNPDGTVNFVRLELK